MPPTRTSALVPAAARQTTVLTDVEETRNAEAIETFATALGGRDALTDALSVASTAPEVERVVNTLLDPRYKRWSLRRICTLHGLTVAEVFAAYKKARITRAHLQATMTIAEKLPPIVTDVMEKALSDPTVERQKLALELGGLLEKKGGIVVQQNAMAIANAAAVNTAPGALEQLQQAVGDLLFSPKRKHGPPDATDPRPEPVEPGRYDPIRPEEEDDAPFEEDVPLPFEDPPPAAEH